MDVLITVLAAKAITSCVACASRRGFASRMRARVARIKHTLSERARSRAVELVPLRYHDSIRRGGLERF